MSQEFTINKEETQSDFNKAPPSSNINKVSPPEYVTLQPPPPPSYVLPSDQSLPYISSFYRPYRSRVKHIISTLRQVEGTCMETLCYVNILDQDAYGTNTYDNGDTITIAFQSHIIQDKLCEIIKIW